MRIIKFFFLVSIIMLLYVECHAQSLTIKSVSLQPMDRTAIDQPVLDNNGDTCALIKIKIGQLHGVEFTNKNQYVKADYNDGIYLVYMPSIGRKLDFSHKDYLNTQLDMAEYGFKRLKGGKTYLVVAEVPTMIELKSSVVLNVEPESAHVNFNGEDMAHIPGGTYKFSVPSGNYRYLVSLDNYVSRDEILEVGKSDVKTVKVKLQPIMHRVKVHGNVKNARVIVENIDYGKVGTMYLPQGLQNIRIIADGYNDFSTLVNINASTTTIDFVLEENHLVEHVHATPVTIYSKGTKVYKNNKEIKEWNTNNNTVRLMPGKYSISDDLNNKEIIEVGTSPMKVSLSDTPSFSSSSDCSSYNSSMTNGHDTTNPNYNTQRKVTTGNSYNANNYNTQRRMTFGSSYNNNNTQRRANESMRRNGTSNTQRGMTGNCRSTHSNGSPRRNSYPSPQNRR